MERIATPSKTGQTAAADTVPMPIKLSYGFGAVAYGIKDNGFAVFLLYYYNQVVGLPATLVSLAIMVALLVDAFIDPLVGQFSDRTRTRLGRRHPWLYASALPIAIFWILLWNPPDGSLTLQFLYLTVVAMFVRVAISCYEVPSLALLPELSKDYHERTRVLRYRTLFGWASGLLIMIAAYGVFLVPEGVIETGLLNPAGYSRFAIAGAIAMILAVLVSAVGTQKRIVGNYNAEVDPPPSAENLRQMLSMMMFKPFLLLLFAGIFAYAAQGLIFSLTPYLLTHVWEFSQSQFVHYSLVLFVSVLTSFFLVTPVSKWLGKPKAASRLTLIAGTFGTLPYALRYFDLFPANDSPAMIPLLYALLVFAIGAGISVMILTMSMMADVADASEEVTGKRTEGVFSAGVFFMQKCVTGIGIFIAGAIIQFSGLQDGAAPGTATTGTVQSLIFMYIVLIGILAGLGAWAYTLFPLTEDDHNRRIAKLAVRSRQGKGGRPSAK